MYQTFVQDVRASVSAVLINSYQLIKANLFMEVIRELSRMLLIMFLLLLLIVSFDNMSWLRFTELHKDAYSEYSQHQALCSKCSHLSFNMLLEVSFIQLLLTYGSAQLHIWSYWLLFLAHWWGLFFVSVAAGSKESEFWVRSRTMRRACGWWANQMEKFTLALLWVCKFFY